MELTPPHSPPHEQHLSAKLHSLQHDREMFAKRPISPPLSSGETSDAGSDEHHSHPPVSLLTALLHSPDSQHHHALSRPTSSAQGQSAYLSPHSSVPSTAVSSPNLKPGLSNQHVPAMSILRRDSVSSDSGDAFAMTQSHCLPAEAAPCTDTRVDLPKRASSLKFAVAPPLKRRQAEAEAAEAVPPVPKLKADVPQRSNTDETETEPEESPITTNGDEDEEMEEEDEGRRSGSEDSDLGYQEDSEQSDDDGDRIRSGPKYPFARSTNYRRRRQEARSPSPPPAPAVLPPPSRRGRGHIRVDSNCISGKETEGGCSRHRSPPPSKSRSRSTSGERIGRLSDAGPRQNRAGSPMPSKILEASSDEDEEESPSKPTPAKRGLGWRSDDAAFYGPKSQVKGIRAVSAPSAVISDEEEHDGGFTTSSIAGHDSAGVRSFFRRASEHLPAFRRPRPVEPPLPTETSFAGPPTHTPTPRTAIPNYACPPALDDTPAHANSIARVETNYSGGLAHRLEKTLSTRASELHAHA